MENSTKTKDFAFKTAKTENPKLCCRVLKSGQLSLYLSYYFGYTKDNKAGAEHRTQHRQKENLNLYLYANPSTPQERIHNNEIITLAKKIRFEREQELLQDKKGYRVRLKQEVNFFDFAQMYIQQYKKHSNRFKASLMSFKAFISQSMRYRCFADCLTLQEVNNEMVKDFAEHLQENHRGGGAKAYFGDFKQIINFAYKHELITKNPCEGISIRVYDEQQKEVLSEEEITILSETHYPKENPNTKRAFLFSCLCGIRFCDVKRLTFANVDFANGFLRFEQSKVKGRSSASVVEIPLNETLLNLIGKPQQPKNKKELIFKLASHKCCIKSLERWTKRAGINKHITWHCARHSFGTIAVSKTKDLNTVANLMGHSSLAQVQRYARVLDENKRKALATLPQIKI